MSNYKIETKCIQSGYKPGNGDTRVLPIYQSTTYSFDSSEYLGDLFDLKAPGDMYTRISNPTVSMVAQKIADMEGGVGAMLTSSGQAASLISILNICQAGQNFVCLSSIYGGTVNLFAVTMKKMGIEVRFITPEMSEADVNNLFDENTRLVFGETIANPELKVLDIEYYADLAHKHHVPFIVDNTFATPVLCRPFEFGADIVIHSTTKYMDGRAAVVGGVIIDSGNFDWHIDNKYPELTEPDESYHGVVYTESFGKSAYITKACTQLMRDLGSTCQPIAAFLLDLGLSTLAVRMERHCKNAETVAEYLKNHDKIEYISYPSLPESPDYELSKKYLPNGCSGVISFGVKGGRDAAMKFMDSLQLASICVHVAATYTMVLHPASTTHRQLTDEQLKGCGILPNQIRLSVGIENVEDIIADLENALQQI